MHVHAEHSNYGAATMTETFEYAFKPLAQGGAGLDFITLSDYVSATRPGTRSGAIRRPTRQAGDAQR